MVALLRASSSRKPLDSASSTAIFWASRRISSGDALMAFHSKPAAARSSSDVVGSLSREGESLSTGSRSMFRLRSTGSSCRRGPAGRSGCAGRRTTLGGRGRAGRVADALGLVALAAASDRFAGAAGAAGPTGGPVTEDAGGKAMAPGPLTDGLGSADLAGSLIRSASRT